MDLRGNGVKREGMGRLGGQDEGWGWVGGVGEGWKGVMGSRGWGGRERERDGGGGGEGYRGAVDYGLAEIISHVFWCSCVRLF